MLATDAVKLLAVTDRTLTIQLGDTEYEVPCDSNPNADGYRGPYWSEGGWGGDAVAIAALDSLDERALSNALRDLWYDPEHPAITLYPVGAREAA